MKVTMLCNSLSEPEIRELIHKYTSYFMSHEVESMFVALIPKFDLTLTQFHDL